MTNLENSPLTLQKLALSQEASSGPIWGSLHRGSAGRPAGEPAQYESDSHHRADQRLGHSSSRSQSFGI